MGNVDWVSFVLGVLLIPTLFGLGTIIYALGYAIKGGMKGEK